MASDDTSGRIWAWIAGGAAALCLSAMLGLIVLLAVQGLAHFWPKTLVEMTTEDGAIVLGEVHARESISVERYLESGEQRHGEQLLSAYSRVLLKTGNRRVQPPDFRWVFTHRVSNQQAPADAAVFERLEWGNVYGYLESLEGPEGRFAGEVAWKQLELALAQANALRDDIESLTSGPLKRLSAESDIETNALDLVQQDIEGKRALLGAYSINLRLSDGSRRTEPIRNLLRAWRPNAMSWPDKLSHFLRSTGRFVVTSPREANTEGGVYPALFGTALLVILMSVFVAPAGVVAAVYLHEYAGRGRLVRIIRIGVTNLAGVPSIVYGVFALGFFVYLAGGSIDRLFFAESLPSPTFGTPGLLWAALTLALLTLPVVIISTEEGLARIPSGYRESSFALGATQAETLLRVVLPAASPALITGVILAVARAAGEVAPLMLVGVVKLAPSLPIDGNFPYLHLDQKIMHLGFHIYDVGFQSPNVEAARPLVYATALLLVLLVVSLNSVAMWLRRRLQLRYPA